MSYTEVSISSYNSNPPPDDGSTGSDNQVTWAGIKTKLADPLKTAIESIDDNVASAVTTLIAADAATDATVTTINSTLTTVQANLYAPSGTKMLFQQTSAPTGWTKVTTHDDKALRIVSGTVNTGGSTAFSSVFTSRTIATENLPPHTHGPGSLSGAVSTPSQILTDYTIPASFGSGSNAAVNSVTATPKSSVVSTMTAGATGSTGSGTAMDFAVNYVDVIIATKD